MGKAYAIWLNKRLAWCEKQIALDKDHREKQMALNKEHEQLMKEKPAKED